MQKQVPKERGHRWKEADSATQNRYLNRESTRGRQQTEVAYIQGAVIRTACRAQLMSGPAYNTAWTPSQHRTYFPTHSFHPTPQNTVILARHGLKPSNQAPPLLPWIQYSLPARAKVSGISATLLPISNLTLRHSHGRSQSLC